MKRLIGLYREKECSPGRHRANDTVLLDEVAERLRGPKLAVELVALNGHVEPPRDAALIFSMCQRPASLATLARWEHAGVSVVNSPRAARRTHRDRLPDLMRNAGVPFPRTQLIDTAKHLNGNTPRNGALWLKRGDVHACVDADVQRVDSPDALDGLLAEFHARGIAQAAVQSHCDGDEIKFYGVRGSEFFHWFYSREPNGHPVNETALRELAARAAVAAGVEIFGGDVIVDANGALTLIDLNDWPSFAPCRDAAADAIADLLQKRLHAR